MPPALSSIVMGLVDRWQVLGEKLDVHPEPHDLCDLPF